MTMNPAPDAASATDKELGPAATYLVHAGGVPAVSFIADRLRVHGALCTSDTRSARPGEHSFDGMVVGAAIAAESTPGEAWETLTVAREILISAIEECGATAHALLIVTDARPRASSRSLGKWSSSVVHDVEAMAGQYALSLTLNAVHLHPDADAHAFADSAATLLARRRFIITGETVTIDRSSPDLVDALVATAL